MTEREKWIRLCHECYIQGGEDAIKTAIPAMMDSFPKMGEQYVEAYIKALHASDNDIEGLIKKLGEKDATNKTSRTHTEATGSVIFAKADTEML